MAADSYGPKGEPQFAGSGPSADAEDLTLLGAFASLVGNRRVGSRAQRLGITGDSLYPGLEFEEIDTGITYIRRGNAWVFRDYDSGWVDLYANTGNNWSNGTGTNQPQIRRVGNLVEYRGQFAGGFSNTTATGIPAFARPNRPITRAVALATATPSFGYVRIFTNGALQPSGNLGPETGFTWFTDATV
jgi:hypothetical protein